MPYDIQFAKAPAGVCLEAVHGGGVVKVRTIEFVSEEDGDTLIDRLEGFGSHILAQLPLDRPIPPSEVQNLLAVIRRGLSATVYLNELEVCGQIHVKGEISARSPVYSDDIADVRRMEFRGVTIPADAGFVYIFSVGWRRAIFYDLSPLAPTGPNRDQYQNRDYDVPTQLARMYSYLMFQKRFRVDDATWANLLQGQWFPFIGLKEATIRNLIAHAKERWPLDDLTDAIATEVREAAPAMLLKWRKNSIFADHVAFLDRAIERYLAGDFVCTTTLLYPRIEGILRSHQKHVDGSAPRTQKGLAASAVKGIDAERHDTTPLMPARFREYLLDVYFAAFDPNDSKIKVSRNSIGHGVAAAEECSLKAATISLLLVDQLSYFVSCTAATQPAGASGVATADAEVIS